MSGSRYIATLCAVVTFFNVGPANGAGFYTVQDLTNDCNSYVAVNIDPKLANSKNLVDMGQCHGFITGVVDSLRYQEANGSASSRVCLNAAADFNTMIASIVERLQIDRRPNEQPAIVAAIDLLAYLYPCR